MARKPLAQLSVVLFLFSTLRAETVTLSMDFVNLCKNRATIDAQLELDQHLTKPHRVTSGPNDGDVHMAGRSQDVRLPLVAEIMNAGTEAESASIKLMNETPFGQTVAVTGVWRIWFEHPSSGNQTQGDPVPVPANANPDHVFEIHPITKFGGNDIGDLSLVPIIDPKKLGVSYSAYPANTAFPAYEKLTATISVSETSVSITARKAAYNYTEFILEPAGKWAQGDNGLFVLANVYDLSDEEAPITQRRMVFVDNTEPAKALQSLPPGGRLHVLGVPRVNLAEVAAIAPGDSVDMALPYELIVVALYPDSASGDESSTDSGFSTGTSSQEHKPKKPTEPKP